MQRQLRQLLSAGLLSLLASAASAQAAELRWRHAHELTLEGRGWDDTAEPYGRLPKKAEARLDPVLYQLGRTSSGVAVRFLSDAVAIRARWTVLSRPLALPHLAASAASGLDLYTRIEDGTWHWIGLGKPSAFPTNEEALITGLDPGEREYLLYLPLYNGLSELQLGVPAAASLEPAPPRPASQRAPLVVYGTSITQGASASRPGLTYAAQLGRWLDRPVINLGFSGLGRMDLPLAVLLGELDAAAYVIDCLPNMNGALIQDNMLPFFTRLRNMRRDTPILLVEDRTFSNARFRRDLRKLHQRSREELLRGLDVLRAGGVEHITLLGGAALLGDDGEATVDSSHPNDLGMRRIAEAMLPHLQTMLKPATGSELAPEPDAATGSSPTPREDSPR